MTALASPASSPPDRHKHARPETLPRLLSRQHGVVSLRQARSYGLAMSTISYRIRAGGPWQRILPGVYLTQAAKPTPDQRHMAALLYAGPLGVITGLTALRRYGLAVSGDQKVDVLVPVGCGRASRQFVRVHRTARMPSRVVVQGKIQLALPPRAVLDATQHLASPSDICAVVAGAVQLGLCVRQELQTELSLGRYRNAARIRAALAEVAMGVRSAPEGDLIDLIRRAGLPAPLCNPSLYLDGAFLAQPDAWWADVSVAAEVDSRKHHSSPDDWQQTMRRHTRMTAAGIRVLHFSPAEIRAQPDMVIARIRETIATGTPIPRIRTVPRTA
jgi:hypothetical protein